MLKLRHRNHDDVDKDRLDKDRLDADRLDTDRLDTDRLDTDRVDTDRVDTDRTESTVVDRRSDRSRDIGDDPTVVDRALDPDDAIDDRTIVRERRPAVVDSPNDLPPPPDQVGVRVEQIVTETTFSPGQMVIMLAGAVSLAFGIAAIAQGGLGGSMTEPVVQVFDFNHTPALGLIEAGAGIVLMLTGLHAALRPLAGLFGALIVAAGVVVLAEIDWVQENLAAEQGFGWVPIAIGGAVLLAAFALPATTRRRVTVVR